jgi:hypothetical protein
MNYSLSNMLSRSSAGGAPVISGTTFPGETLSSNKTKQWYANGNAISGETGSTYMVRLSDIGKSITQEGSNELVIWHPNSITGVARFWSSLSDTYNSVSPDVLATNGQTVRRWTEIINSTQADQTIGVSQPLYQATGQSGNPAIQFDGSNDYLNMGANSTVLQNKTVAYLICGFRETSPTAGSSSHMLMHYSVNTPSNPRLSLYSRRSGNNFAAIGRRLDGETAVIALSANNSNYNVLASHADFSTGTLRLRVNGSVLATTAMTSSGSTSNTPSLDSSIGGYVSFIEPAFGFMTAACVVNASVTATELSQIERYIGLFGGLNIPLV